MEIISCRRPYFRCDRSGFGVRVETPGGRGQFNPNSIGGNPIPPGSWSGTDRQSTGYRKS
ncbi:hypothetical protein ACRALDRAFT_208310 [Sodiomyces alcalophilus JCM 7366]|uniref:uncharacterized protein n=1 Tax=Sodiomyces alcalophilus JCM 7366 TaxID=591952 RepID=UPI0039B4DE45